MLYTVLVTSGRDELINTLHDRGIEGRLYFRPAHLQPIFLPHGRHLPVTESVAPHMLSIPFHSQLAPEELSEIAEVLEASAQSAGN